MLGSSHSICLVLGRSGASPLRRSAALALGSPGALPAPLALHQSCSLALHGSIAWFLPRLVLTYALALSTSGAQPFWHSATMVLTALVLGYSVARHMWFLGFAAQVT